MLVDGLKPALISSLVGQLARGEKLDSRVAKSECQNSSFRNALDKKEFSGEFRKARKSNSCTTKFP